MVAPVEEFLCLPSADNDEVSQVIDLLEAQKTSYSEPVDEWFEFVHRRLGNKVEIDEESPDVDDDQPESPEETEYLKSLDPKEWREQDHYRVLGLKDKRYKATDNDIKRAYRRKVLLHHPDKRKNAGENVGDIDADYFSCITRAYDILSNPKTRTSYDSVDPEIDDSVPPVNNVSKKNFFAVFGPVFERNARWNNSRKKVPSLGDENTPFEQVDAFYNFWYNFESWREYSYLDEEEKERAENRDERRWIEKQNKAVRQRRKKEEMQRIRQLVDNAYECDFRIKQHIENEKQEKIRQKEAKQAAQRAKLEEDERLRRDKLEAERLERERQEQEEKDRKDRERKEKEANRRRAKQLKKQFEAIAKEEKNFVQNDGEAASFLPKVNQLLVGLTTDELDEFVKQLTATNASDERRKIFLDRTNILQAKIAAEKASHFKSTSGASATSNSTGTASKSPWSPEDIQLLVKAVNLFPAGTGSRWEVVAQYVNQHSTSGIERSAKEVLSRAKEFQKSEQTLKEEASKNAFCELEKKNKGKNDISDAFKDGAPEVSQRFELPSGDMPWSADEQKLLEQALKTYPASTPERWDRIAEAITTRTKKECMKRYKELVEKVREKKAAISAVAAKK